MGKCKLDEAKKREVVAILSVGASRTIAAEYVGCVFRTIARTADRDPEFAAALRQAEIRHEIVNLQNIQEAGKKHWRASSWLLERSFPDRYGRRPPQTINVEELTYIVARFANIVAREVKSPDDRLRVLKRLDALARRLCGEPATSASSKCKKRAKSQ